MADEIALIKRELKEELTGSQEKLVQRYDNAVRTRLVEANDPAQQAAESTVGGILGMVAAELAGATALWAQKQGFQLLGSRRANFWAGLAKLGVGTGTFAMNAAVPTRPVPGALRQTIRGGATVAFFLGLEETLNAAADWWKTMPKPAPAPQPPQVTGQK